LVIIFFLFRLNRVTTTSRALDLDFFFDVVFRVASSSFSPSSSSRVAAAAVVVVVVSVASSSSATRSSARAATRAQPTTSQYSSGHAHDAQYSTSIASRRGFGSRVDGGAIDARVVEWRRPHTRARRRAMPRARDATREDGARGDVADADADAARRRRATDDDGATTTRRTTTTARTTSSDVADALDACLTIEATARDDGRDEGVVAGRAMGAREGREMGFRKGFELAEEVGYYAGCAAVWRTCATRDGDARGGRVERLIESFERELEESAIGNPLDEGILERVERLRGRFKTLAALLGRRGEHARADASLGISF
jgi:hypothetical protein